MIQTVLGEIKKELGVCLTHEHVWCDQSLGPRFELLTIPEILIHLCDCKIMISRKKN